MEKKDLPIGYWIKQADALLTNGIDAIHNTQGIDRTEWQILHTLHTEPNSSMDEVAELMKIFSDRTTLEKTIEHLIANGWVSSAGAKLYLTVSGEAFHTNCLQQQAAFRSKSMQHISQRDYETTVATLRQLVQNLS